MFRFYFSWLLCFWCCVSVRARSYLSLCVRFQNFYLFAINFFTIIYTMQSAAMYLFLPLLCCSSRSHSVVQILCGLHVFEAPVRFTFTVEVVQYFLFGLDRICSLRISMFSPFFDSPSSKPFQFIIAEHFSTADYVPTGLDSFCIPNKFEQSVG